VALFREPSFNPDRPKAVWPIPLMTKLIFWSVMIVEAEYPVFIWPHRTRSYWLAGILTLHIAIGVFMGLWLFSLTLIVMNLSAFGRSARRRTQAAM